MDAPSPCPDADALARLTLGRLADREADALSRHIEACPECRVRLADFDRLSDPVLRSLRGLAGRPADTRPTTPRATLPPSDDPLPRDLGEYRLIEKIGQGGMGVVYRAEHTLLGRAVAIKVLTASRQGHPLAEERFLREVRAVAAVEHPGIVRATDARRIDDCTFLVMEFLEGEDLGRRLKRDGALPLAEAIDIGRQVALGLAAAHAAGLVHRDIKPSNVHLSASGAAKILDLGLVRLLAADATALTDTTQVMGTVDYMSPEQARDPRSADARSDLYSLGCTLFALLSGCPPYATGHATLATLLLSHQTGPIPDVRTSRPETPDGLARLVRRLMDRDPATRPQSAAEVARLLADIRPADPAPSAEAEPRRLRWTIPAAAGIVGLALAFWPSKSPEPLPMPPNREEAAEVLPMPRERPAIDRKHWQILGPFLFPDLRTAAESPWPFAARPIDPGAKYLDGGRELVWQDAGTLSRLSVADVAAKVPADREGVYYLRGWTRLRAALPTTLPTVEWDGLKCSYKMKMWIEGECINEQSGPLVSAPKGAPDREYYDQVWLWTIPESAKADWSEVVLRVLVSPKAKLPLEVRTRARLKGELVFGYFERE